jgi:EmrB/QacA subfamily drug resistance transporter
MRAPRYLVPMIVACALFMENMDATVIATALPTIARDFGESPLRLNLAISAYLLSLALFIPLSGWLADRFGARTVFCSAIVIFTLGSLGCSLVETLPQLVAARVLQGMGGAMMVPVGRLVVLRMIPKSELVSAMAYLTVPALIGPVIGPPLGGFIVTYASWRWIFLINLPIGVLGFALATTFIGNLRETHEEPLDVKGFAIVSLGLAATMFAFENLGRGVVAPAILAVLIAGGVSLLGWYTRHARSLGSPILDLTLLRVRTFRASLAGGFVFRMGIGAMPFLLPLMLQLGFGFTPFASGMVTFAGAAGAMTMKLAAAPILRWLGFRVVLLANTILCAIFMASCGLFAPATPRFLMIAALLVGGFFRSLQFTSLNTLAYAEISEASMSRATTLASVGQQLSLTFGVGLGALLLHATLVFSGKAALGPRDFAPAFFAIAALSLVSLCFFLPLPRDAGSEISGREDDRHAVANATHASG